MAIEDINLVGEGGVVLDIFSGLLLILMAIVSIIIIIAFFWLLRRLMNYNIDAELWEKKGNEVFYAGDDKIKRQVLDGNSYMIFRTNKDERFKFLPFPSSKYLIRKKLFGSKIKILIDGNDIKPFTMTLKEQGLVITDIPETQRIQYVQRQKNIAERYQNQDKRAQMIALVIGVTFIGVVFFGLFVIWQSNVATAEATKALAGSVVEASKNIASVTSIPAE